MKDHEKRELVNTLMYVAIEFNNTQQLRERLAEVVYKALAIEEARIVNVLVGIDKEELFDPEGWWEDVLLTILDCTTQMNEAILRNIYTFSQMACVYLVDSI